MMTLKQAKASGYRIAGEFGASNGCAYLGYLPDDTDEALAQWADLDDDGAAFLRDPFADGQIGRRPWVLVAIRDDEDR